MNVLIYTQSYYTRNTFVNALIPSGINLFHTVRPENINNKILQLNPEIVILDAIQENFATVFELVRQIKKHSSELVNKTTVILHIGSIDKNDIISAIQCGIIGFIKNDSSEDFIYKYIINTYQKVLGVPPERKFVRISIDDNIGMKFRSPNNSKLIIGQIKDISIGGVAAKLIGIFPVDSLIVGLEVKNIQFILDGKNIFINGIVVSYQENFCAFRFMNMTPEIRETISQYVFKKISTLEEEIKVNKTEIDIVAGSIEKEIFQRKNNVEQLEIIN